MKSRYEYWTKRAGKIFSRKGKWEIGKGVFSHGYNLLEDLLFCKSYMQIVVLNATGKECSKEFSIWLEAIHICLSWPDPRIWCNRIGALGGSAQSSPVASVFAGVLSSDSISYGIKPLLKGAQFIRSIDAEVQLGEDVEKILAKRIQLNKGRADFMGYARPIAKGDERVAAMIKFSEKNGIIAGKHFNLAKRIEAYLHDRYGESMNINGYISAVMADYDYTPEEVYDVFSFLVVSGVVACYVDAKNGKAGGFSPMADSAVEYVGKENRKV